MEQLEIKKQLADKPNEVNSVVVQSSDRDKSAMLPPRVTPSGGETSCNNGGCGGSKPNGNGTTYPYVYALGKVVLRFPSLSIEKEFAQTTARAGKETVGLTNQKALHKILSERSNRYLVRQFCWVLTVEGVDTYILQPNDPLDFELLIDAIHPVPSPLDIDVVIGVRGPIAPPEMCNGLMVPIVMFDQIYSFDRPKFIDALEEKRPENMSVDEFTSASEEVLDRIMQMADNAGATDEHRALNYVALRYDVIYAKSTEMHQRNFSLTDVVVGTSRLSGTRKIVAPIFTYTHRETDFVEKYFMRVDVTEEFPFLVTKMSPYYDR